MFKYHRDWTLPVCQHAENECLAWHFFNDLIFQTPHFCLQFPELNHSLNQCSYFQEKCPTEITSWKNDSPEFFKTGVKNDTRVWEDICVTHLIIILKLEVSTYLIVLFFRSCVSEIKSILAVIFDVIYGVVCFQLTHFSCDDCENTCTSSSNRKNESLVIV